MDDSASKSYLGHHSNPTDVGRVGRTVAQHPAADSAGNGTPRHLVHRFDSHRAFVGPYRKEKILAAVRAGIKTIVIPKANKKDLVEIPPNLLRKVNVLPVQNMTEVLQATLEDKP